MNFDKSSTNFPVKKRYAFLNNCGVAAMYNGAAQRICDFARDHSTYDPTFFPQYPTILHNIHKGAGELLKVPPRDISLIKNTAEGLNMIANGYPFEKGDEIISYIHEYPSNHYPWKLQEKRGVTLKLLSDTDPIGGIAEGKARGWSFDELEKLVTKKTRVIAISHVQFTSGFTCDLPKLGLFCKERNIDLVVDVAQSLGCIPVYPAEWNVACVATSGWKWMLGPVGTGLLYTSPEFRAKIEITMTGANMMQQGEDFLNHDWNPHTSGHLFEYSTHQIALGAGLDACINELLLKYGVENIKNEIFRLQNLFLASLNNKKFTPLVMPEKHRSGILSIDCGKEDTAQVINQLAEKNILCSSRGDYLRIAPHFYNDDEEMLKAATALNEL